MHFGTQHCSLNVIASSDHSGNLFQFISILNLIKQKSKKNKNQVTYQISTLFSFNVLNLVCNELSRISTILMLADVFSCVLLTFDFPLNFNGSITHSVPFHHSMVLTCLFFHNQMIFTSRWFSAHCCGCRLWGSLVTALIQETIWRSKC